MNTLCHALGQASAAGNARARIGMRKLLAAGGPPAGIAAVLVAVGWMTLPQGLALYFAAAAIVTLLVPAMVLTGTEPVERLIAAAAVAGAACVMTVPDALAGSVPATAWMRCAAVLACYACALGAVSVAINRAGLPAPAASALTVALAMAWLTWPAWLAAWLGGPHRQTVAAALVAGHPLFAMNGALSNVLPTPWLQHGLAYRHTNLGDDIPYRLPAGILWCAVVHLGAAAMALGAPRLAQATAVRLRRRK